jgi:hypothetical protein
MLCDEAGVSSSMSPLGLPREGTVESQRTPSFRVNFETWVESIVDNSTGNAVGGHDVESSSDIPNAADILRDSQERDENDVIPQNLDERVEGVLSTATTPFHDDRILLVSPNQGDSEEHNAMTVSVGNNTCETPRVLSTITSVDHVGIEPITISSTWTVSPATTNEPSGSPDSIALNYDVEDSDNIVTLDELIQGLMDAHASGTSTVEWIAAVARGRKLPTIDSADACVEILDTHDSLVDRERLLLWLTSKSVISVSENSYLYGANGVISTCFELQHDRDRISSRIRNESLTQRPEIIMDHISYV